MRQPEAGPDRHGSEFIKTAHRLIECADDPTVDERATRRLQLSCTTPASWHAWVLGSEARLIGRRAPNTPASDVEVRLFGQARALITSVLSRLELRERAWLASRLDRREENGVDQFTPHLQLTADFVGLSWGLVLTVRLATNGAAARLASLDGVLQRDPQRAAA
jgi:hypothetical protein